MTTSQRLTAIIVCLTLAFHGAALAVLSWAAEHSTLAFLIAAMVLAAPLFRRRRQYGRRTAKAPPHAHYDYAA